MSLRWPALGTVLAESRRTFVRFPFAATSALAAAVLANLLVQRNDPPQPLLAAFFTATLGIPLFVAIRLAVERGGRERPSVLWPLVGLAVLVGFAVAFPSWRQPVQIRRCAQLAVAFHLLVAFLPYLRRGEANGFWQYNRTVFLRFVTAVLYSAVLYVGLTVALVAVDKLFGVRIPSNLYLRLWICVAFVFNTGFFLAGVPRDFPVLDGRRDYPAQLRVFAQFILVPLVAVYLLILTAYLGRVLITSQWPNGWIGWLVSSVAATGILSLLLIHPVRDQAQHQWVRTYARWFYVAMLPSIGMLLAAIGKRIAQYGITEDRYFLLVLALWLAGVAVTFIVRRNADLRVIPISLCAIALVTMLGPWGAYAASMRSQQAHARHVLTRVGLFPNGMAKALPASVPFEARKELSSTFEYLVDTHGLHSVRPILGQELMAAVERDRAVVPSSPVIRERSSEAARYWAGSIMRVLGMDFVQRWESPQQTFFAYNETFNKASEVLDVSDFQYHVRVRGTPPIALVVGGTPCTLAVAPGTQSLRLVAQGGGEATFPLDTLVLRARAGARGDSMPSFRLAAETPALRALLVPQTLDGKVDSSGFTLNNVTADLYLLWLGRPPETR